MTDTQQPDEPVTTESTEQPEAGQPEAGLAEGGLTEPKPERPRPGSSPTSRARRAAAAAVQSAAPTRRPSPRPADQAETGASTETGAGTEADAGTANTGTADARPTGAKIAGSKARTASAAEQADAKAEQTAQPHRVRARSPRWLAALLAVLALLLAGASAWLVIAAPGQAGSVSQRDQALSAAKTSVALILSYDYRTFDASQAKAQAQLTGSAKSQYVDAMTKTIKPAAIKSKVVVQAQTDSAGVEAVSADGKQVTMVVFGQQNVTNTSLSAPRIDPFRVRATMNLVAGHWLVSAFVQI